ncbi:MAG: D-tyrosyl-tRNA(Tyr) deacylase [Bacteroidetes bacterium]|uniref:D-aminoacyl-tRNA deacylase n=1 Tax=Candidatus Cryptobacteroides merdigallinarum TaxID=2840770 RepID=A0A9D9EMB5_9BACT|nr:D-tyrosyl-tRNA(Tyr) deacylase [Candidatus Cryptobacteroides merdigallinarum]
MRVVIQRVSTASVSVPAENYQAGISSGLLVLAAFEEGDGPADIEWTARKICALRIFDDSNGVMNISVKDTGGDILAVSQFTLYASTARGNRPSYIRAASPEISSPLYDSFCSVLGEHLGKPVQKGIFGADMKVSLLNDGPVTIIIDSKQKE